MPPERKAFIDRFADALINWGQPDNPDRKQVRDNASSDLGNIGCGLWVLGVVVLAPLARYFHRTGGLDGPTGVAAAIGISIAILAAVGFILGWAFLRDGARPTRSSETAMSNSRRATAALMLTASLLLASCSRAAEGDVAFCTLVIETGSLVSGQGGAASSWQNRDWIEDGLLLGIFVAAVSEVADGRLSPDEGHARVVERCDELGVRRAR